MRPPLRTSKVRRGCGAEGCARFAGVVRYHIGADGTGCGSGRLRLLGKTLPNREAARLALLSSVPGDKADDLSPVEVGFAYSEISTSSMRRRSMRVSPLRVGYGPRAGSVSTLIGHRIGMLHSTRSRLGCPRPRIFPSRSTR